MSITLLTRPAAWPLEDFNLEGDPPAEPAIEPALPEEPVETVEDPVAIAWNDGYINAARHAREPAEAAWPKAELAEALLRLEDNLKQSAEQTAALIAELLVTAAAAATPSAWAGGLPERIDRMQDVIRPALLSATPEFSLRSETGQVILTAKGPVTPAAWAESLSVADGVTITWAGGRAETSRSALVRDLAAAIAPLVSDILDHPPAAGTRNDSGNS